MSFGSRLCRSDADRAGELLCASGAGELLCASGAGELLCASGAGELLCASGAGELGHDRGEGFHCVDADRDVGESETFPPFDDRVDQLLDGAGQGMR